MGVSGIPITITGSLDEVQSKLLAAKTVTSYRKEVGWTLFQIDEDWEYEPIFDDRLCPVCADFAGQWLGVQIPIKFPDLKRSEHPIFMLMNNEVYPNVHTTYPFLKGDCRCILHWNDYLYILMSRLMNEIEEVTA